MAEQAAPRPFLPYSVIIAIGCLIALLTFGPRATMGLFLAPMTIANDWSREAFSLAIALQNLMWGLGQPLAGMIADRYGTAKVLSIGAVLYAAGLVMMAYATDPLTLQLSAGVLIGLGISGSALFLVLAAFARLLPEHLRSIAFGLGTAAGSAGQLVFAPIGRAFIDAYGFQTALVLLALFVVVVPLLSIPFRGKPKTGPDADGHDQSVREALSEAFGHRSYNLLTAGFFVCGFHVAFITVHLPPYIQDLGLDPSWGAWAIAAIGLFNIAGAILSGYLGGIFAKRKVLSLIYLGRAIVIAIFLMLPPTPATIIAFSAAMGLLWLSTIPLTQGLVMVMFGPRYMATLFGFVFLSHQVGSFLGIWLGGVLYDQTGSYDPIWWIGIALGIFAALVHWPIKEAPVERPATA